MIVKYRALRRETRRDSLYTVVAAEYAGFTITNPHNPTDGSDDEICVSFESVFSRRSGQAVGAYTECRVRTEHQSEPMSKGSERHERTDKIISLPNGPS
jgi:hypothetical protein